ncbi:DUF4114 domain-containing protein [Melittangium boletus]|uniref:DUF4114 domain-containing protein n=1 Tax=Melittangium boletus TaxID=83453 RepID=UPI003DA5CE37
MSSPRILSLVAGGVLSVLAAPRPALAGNGPLAVHLPPQFTEATQSAESLFPGDASQLGVSATDPEGGPLTFSWSASTGTLGTQADGANDSQVGWTAPACLAEDSTPVTATVTNAYGLSSTASFDFHVAADGGRDHQPPFSVAGFEQLRDATVLPDPAVRTAAAAVPTSSERIVFPEPTALRVSFVGETATAANALGWVYYDDLVARGYVDAQGALVDGNANGILDLHEDLYNLAPPSGPKARPYVGTTRRCTRTFLSEQQTFSVPDLASDASCAISVARRSLPDARPGAHAVVATDVVSPSSLSADEPGFSDRGLFARVPNLLEPAHPLNGYRGLGKLVFLRASDDPELPGAPFGAVPDVVASPSQGDGIPDYDVSAFDAQGLPRSVNPDPGITPADRSVDLGVIPPEREIVFFLVSGGGPVEHSPQSGRVFPCLRKAADGRCTLHLVTPLSIFFSKTAWNLDQDPLGRLPAVERNIGCVSPSDDGQMCQVSPSGLCPTMGTRRPCGWLPGPYLNRLATQPAYGHAVLPLELTTTAPVNGMMPHVLLTAPSSTPGQWMLGFEDLNGGGDRDFNDVVFAFQALRPGLARSRAVALDEACTLSRVRLRKSDGLVGTRCTATTVAPIAYAVATDCQVCDAAGTCTPNPSPTWSPLSLPWGEAETVVDVSARPGAQLCWKADLPPPLGVCQPTLFDVDLGFQAVPR